MQNYCISSYIVCAYSVNVTNVFHSQQNETDAKRKTKKPTEKKRKTHIQVISSKWFDVESFVCTLKFLLTNTANFLQSIAKSDTTTTKKKLQIILKHLSHFILLRMVLSSLYGVYYTYT